MSFPPPRWRNGIASSSKLIAPLRWPVLRLRRQSAGLAVTGDVEDRIAAISVVHRLAEEAVQFLPRRERTVDERRPLRALAAQQKARHQPNAGNASRPRLDGKKALDKKLDEALEGSFPGSDPVSFVEAAPVKERDRSLPAVRVAEQQQPEKTEAARKSK